MPVKRHDFFRTCPLCEATCGLKITMYGDQVLRTAGDDKDVFSKGFMCPKGATLGELYSDTDWLRSPVIRKGKEFKHVTWNEAFKYVHDLVQPLIRKYGPEVMSIYMGNPISHNLGGLLYTRAVVKALKTPNLYSPSSLDQRPKDLTNALMFGDKFTVAVPDIDRTDFMIILGANPVESNGSLATAPGWPKRLRALRERGGTLVVIDPVKTRTAELAHEHLRPRVGSDAALLASMVYVLFEEQLINTARLSAFIRGVERLKDEMKDFAPEMIESYTQISAITVRNLTRSLASAKSACVYGRIGTTTTQFGSIASWMIDVLNILTGNLDRPGGVMFPLPASGSANTAGKPQYGKPPRMGRFHSRVRNAPELFGELPTSCLAEEIDTPGKGQYRGLLLISGNPVVSSPNSERMDKALSSLDALIAVDPYINNSTRHAHVILPPPSPLQRSHYDVHFSAWAVRNIAKYSPAAIPLESCQMHEWEIMCRLVSVFEGSNKTTEVIDKNFMESLITHEVKDSYSSIYGRDVLEIIEKLKPLTGPERILDFRLRVGPYGDGFGVNRGDLNLSLVKQFPHGIDLGPMKSRLPEVLRTPDGLINISPKLLVADLQRLLNKIAIKPDNQLVLIGRRHVRSNNSWMHNTPSLMTGRLRSTLYINPVDAARRGIEIGGIATIESETGSLDVAVEVTDRIAPGAVSLPHGWLHDKEHIRLNTAQVKPGVNSNRLADEKIVDAPSWTAVLSGIPVKVFKSLPRST